jgi:hypothetical protein
VAERSLAAERPLAAERAPAAERRPAAHRLPAAERAPARKVVHTPVDVGPPATRGGGQPRRLLTTLFFLAFLAGMLLVGKYVGAPAPTATAPAPARPAAPGAAPATVITSRTDSTDTGRPAAGTSGHFAYAEGYGPVLGSAGPIRRFKVAVEKPAAPAAAATFADEVNRTLGDPRSWIAGRRWRLQRVPNAAHAEFTVYLASARTSRKMCRTGGLETGGYTSCRLPRQVIINDDRWEAAVRGYGAPLAVYRAYAINHEVGHQLGHGHEACPGQGRPAPVMMQQTYGLRGCRANPWPYPDGNRYAGPPVP